jgi:hypothetical protein
MICRISKLCKNYFYSSFLCMQLPVRQKRRHLSVSQRNRESYYLLGLGPIAWFSFLIMAFCSGTGGFIRFKTRRRTFT